MHVVMGGTGHVGSAVARPLLSRSNKGAIVTHDIGKADALRALGAEIVEADVNDVSVRRRSRLPMIAPHDLGEAATQRLISDIDDVGVRYIEGPKRYTPTDVANALSDILGRPIQVRVTWLLAPMLR
jgi:uncharacterized protein YbjT (DUF2867 family)